MHSTKQVNMSQFGPKQFLKAALPSYLAPILTAGLPGYFLNKPELLRASYTSIALPSLISTILTFIILSQFQKTQVFLYNRFIITFVMGGFMVLLAFLIIFFFDLHQYIWDIVPSAFLGAAIVALTNPLKKVDL